MDKATIITLLLVFFVGAGLSWWAKPAEIIDRTNYQQEQLDSLTAVIRNRTATAQSLKDSLASTSTAFREYVDEHQGQVASLTTIRGRLKLKVDSLSRANEQLALSSLFTPDDDTTGQVFRDTTLTTTKTFGDSLIQAISTVGFRQDSLTNDIDISQLRPVRIDLAVLVSEDRRTVESVATSPDFDSLRVTAQTSIEPPKKRIHWSVLMAIGMLAREGVDLLLK